LLKLFSRIRKKSNIASALDSGGKSSLMLSASACYTAGKDLTSLANELAKSCDILIIDLFNSVYTEVANLLVGLATKSGSFVLFHFQLSPFLCRELERQVIIT
jgi:hypothetical protein